MISKEDIIPQMQIQLIEAISIRNTDYTVQAKEFAKGTIFTVIKMSKDKTNPRLTLQANDKSLWTLTFRHHCHLIQQYGEPASADIEKAHEEKKSEQALKNIKKLAKNDDLQGIILVLDNNPQFLSKKKHAKTLMAYAMMSQSTKVLTYGFEHQWFKSVPWDENVLMGETLGTPLCYAIQKSTLETQMLLISMGAKLSDPHQTNSPYSIKEIITDYGLPSHEDNALDILDKLEKYENFLYLEQKLPISKVEKKPVKI